MIKTAISQGEIRHRRAEEEHLAEDHEAPRGDGVTLRQREWPLVDLVRQTHHMGEAIVWRVERLTNCGHDETHPASTT